MHQTAHTLEVTQYGNLKSITWAENQPVPMHDEVVLCDVAFGTSFLRLVICADAFPNFLYQYLT